MTRLTRSLYSQLSLVILASTLFVANDARALDVQFIEFFWVYDRIEGVPGPLPYAMEILVEGTGIQSVQVVTPGTAGTFNLILDGEQWEIPNSVTQDFNLAADLFSAFPGGTYSFTITGTGGTPIDTFSRTLATPTEVTSYLNISAPTSSTPFPVNGTVTWDDCSACDGSLLVGFVDSFDLDVDSFFDADKTRTTWSPTGLEAGSFYWVEMILGDYEFPMVATTTDTLGDPMSLVAGFESINGLNIQTEGTPVPASNSVGLGVLVAALVLLGAASSRERGRC